MKQLDYTPIVQKHIILSCDNKTLVKRINEQKDSKMTVNQHYGADVDIELQILHELQTLKQMKMTFKIQHVQGHSNCKQLLANTTTTRLDHRNNFISTSISHTNTRQRSNTKRT
jgi:hypothetical protein